MYNNRIISIYSVRILIEKAVLYVRLLDVRLATPGCHTNFVFASLLRGASRETYRGVVLIYCQHRVIMKSTFSHWFYIGEIWQRWNNQESSYYQLTLIYLFQGPSFLQYVKNRFSMFKPWVWVSYLIHAPPWNKQNKSFAPRNCLVGRGFISFWNAIFSGASC